MKNFTRHALAAMLALGLMGTAGTALAGTFIQCPGDTDVPLDGVPDVPVFESGECSVDLGHASALPTTSAPGLVRDVLVETDVDGIRRDIFCQHLTASDGFTTMADGRGSTCSASPT